MTDKRLKLSEKCDRNLHVDLFTYFLLKKRNSNFSLLKIQPNLKSKLNPEKYQSNHQSTNIFSRPFESHTKNMIYDFAAVLSKQTQTCWLEVCNCQ